MPMRRGVALVEAVVAVTLLAVIAGLCAAAVAREWRAAGELAELHASRADLRDAAAILTTELRGAAPLADTLRMTADTAIEFFAPVLAGVTCADPRGGRLLLAPAGEGGGALTSVTVEPDSGDLAWVWVQDSVGELGSWQRRRIAAYSATTPEVCDPELAGAGPRPMALTLEDDVAGQSGAPLYVVRRSRYSVYKSSDGLWYLGYRRCNPLGPSVCGAVQPVAGPYRSRSAGVAGIQFRFFDEAGSELVGALAPTRTARVELVVRSHATRMNRRAYAGGALDDSVVANVALRNSASW